MCACIIMAEGGDSMSSGPDSVVILRDKILDILPYLWSEEIKPVLCREHSQEFKYFCKVHMSEICAKCRRKEHKNCKSIMDMEEAAETVYSGNHGEKIIQSVKDLIKRFNECKVAAEDLKTKISNKRKFAVDKVEQARRNIYGYVDELEANTVAEIDRNLKMAINYKEEQIYVCRASISSLSTIKSNIDLIMSIGIKEDKFVEINRATKQTKLSCNTLVKMYSELSKKIDEFEAQVLLPDIFRSLGTTSAAMSNVADVLMDTHPIYTGEMKITSANDGIYFTVVSFDVLQDGRKLLLKTNSKIQLYDKNNIFVTETALPVRRHEVEKCVSVVLDCNSTALVPTDNGRLFKVTIGDEFSETKIIDGILKATKYGEDVVCLLEDKHQFHLCVMDKSMENITKTMLKDNGTLFEDPNSIGISSETKTIYISDYEKGCYGVTFDGQVVFHYQNPKAEGYLGLVVVSDGLLIGTAIQSGVLQLEKLNFSGELKEVYRNMGDSFPLNVVANELALCGEYGNSNCCIWFYCLFK